MAGTRFEKYYYEKGSGEKVIILTTDDGSLNGKDIVGLMAVARRLYKKVKREQIKVRRYKRWGLFGARDARIYCLRFVVPEETKLTDDFTLIDDETMKAGRGICELLSK